MYSYELSCGLSINSSQSGVITRKKWLAEEILLFSIKSCEAIREMVHF